MLHIGTLCNIHSRQDDLLFSWDDGSHFSGEIVADSGKTLQKILHTEQGGTFHISGVRKGIGAAVIPPDDQQLFPRRADIESIPVKGVDIQLHLGGKFKISHMQSDFPCAFNKNGNFAIEDLPQSFAQEFPCVLCCGGSLFGDHDLKAPRFQHQRCF